MMKVESSGDLKVENDSISWSQAFVWFQIRPYGILFMIALAVYIYKLMNNRTSLKLLVPPELIAKINTITDKMILLRRDHPNIFCGLATLILGTLAVIGHVVSGAYLVLIGLVVAGFLSTRHNFKIVKIPLKVDFSWADKFERDIADEFLPEVNESNLFVLQRASDDAVVTPTGCDDDDKSEEIPSDLLIPDSIPEIDENSDSSDDYMLMKPQASDHQETSNEKIQFKKGYFKKDSSKSTTSSSSDEENLSKGLNFDNVDSQQILLQKSQSTPHTGAAAANLASQLPGIVSNLMSWSMGGGVGDVSGIVGGAGDQNLTVLKSKKLPDNSTIVLDSTDDDDSDFEIVDTDEI